jgi:O-acetyl-ADP-ribose deacetylase (regulator of RNase III)
MAIRSAAEAGVLTSMIRHIGATSLEVRLGDITTCAVDAIVNAANDHLWMGAGVAGAIKQQGGQVIEDEAVRQGPIPVGAAVVTGGGRLQARYVIHAAAMGQDLVTNAELIAQATSNSLRQAAALGLGSIALPALGTGVGGFPIDEAARAMIEATSTELHRTPQTSLQQVVFVLFTEAARQAFEQALAQGLP